MELLAAHDKEKQKAAAVAASEASQPDWSIAAAGAAQGAQHDPVSTAATELAAPAGNTGSSGDGLGNASGSSSGSGTSEISSAEECTQPGSSSNMPQQSAATTVTANSSTIEQQQQQPAGLCSSLIDLSSKVEVAPVVIPPGMPLTFIYHIMQEQGLNYVPVIRHHGPLEGIVTRCVLQPHRCVSHTACLTSPHMVQLSTQSLHML
jgi:hypothetical protein